MVKGKIYNAVFVILCPQGYLIGLRVLEENAKTLAEEHKGTYSLQLLPDLL